MTSKVTDLAVAWLPCPYCGANPGVECLVVTSGNPARYTHADRLAPIQIAWSAGFRVGCEDAALDAVLKLGRLPVENALRVAESSPRPISVVRSDTVRRLAEALPRRWGVA